MSDGTKARIAVHFANELRIYREQADMNREELAEKVDCSAAIIAALEAGERLPTDDLCARVDEVLATGGALGRLCPLVRDEQRVNVRHGRMLGGDTDHACTELPEPLDGGPSRQEVGEVIGALPRMFALVGRGCADMVGNGPWPWTVDAHGVCYGCRVWTWPPRGTVGDGAAWSSVAEAARAHAALVVWADGGVEDPADFY